MGLQDETTSYKVDERSPGSVISDLGLLTNNGNGNALEGEKEKQGTRVETQVLEANASDAGFSSSDTANANESKVYSSEGEEKKPVLIVVMVSGVLCFTFPRSAICFMF